MALSPLDIHNKEFSSKMRGYDKDEVNDFLAQIVKDYSSLIKDNEGLKKELADAKEKVRYFTDMKEALNQSIIVAQESAEKVKNSAHQEADLIKQQAQQDAQGILNLLRLMLIRKSTKPRRKPSRRCMMPNLSVRTFLFKQRI